MAAYAELLGTTAQGLPKYRFRESLNRGSFGFVNLYDDLHSGDQVAIKFLAREKVNKHVKNEILNHRVLCHPHVVKFREVFLTQHHICIAMEYANGGNLARYVQQAQCLKENAARWYFQQLVLGLDYCHRRGIVNRDIKLENTLLQVLPGLPRPLLKICDFGYSKSQEMSAPKSKVGTLAYMAPEVVGSGCASRYDGRSADIWSCGIMLYGMLFGRLPFCSQRLGELVAQNAEAQQEWARALVTRIRTMQWTIPADPAVSAECQGLLRQLIVADPAQRLTMQQILRHPWFLENLPPDALMMNEQHLATPLTDVQPLDQVHSVLHDAPTQAVRLVTTIDEDELYEDMVDEMLQHEQDLRNNRASQLVQQPTLPQHWAEHLLQPTLQLQAPAPWSQQLFGQANLQQQLAPAGQAHIPQGWLRTFALSP